VGLYFLFFPRVVGFWGFLRSDVTADSLHVLGLWSKCIFVWESVQLFWARPIKLA
jgi:hypothetical protein